MMRSKLLLPVMLLVAACSVGRPAVERVEVRPTHSAKAGAPEDAYVAAKRQLALGNAGLAIDAFRKAVRENPNSADALNGLAVAYDRVGRFDLSRQAYEEALALAPSDKAILHNLKKSLITQRLHAEAAQLAAEMGEEPAPPADMAPAAAWAHSSSMTAPAMRLERVSLREVALITARVRSSVDAIDRSTSTVAAKTPPQAQPYAVSKSGKLELALSSSAASGPPVRVLNAVGRRGLARQVSEFLHGRGWSKTTVGDARARLAGSFLVHAPKDKLDAILLAKTLPFRPRLIVSSKVRATTLLLGRNAADFAAARSVSAS